MAHVHAPQPGITKEHLENIKAYSQQSLHLYEKQSNPTFSVCPNYIPGLYSPPWHLKPNGHGMGHFYIWERSSITSIYISAEGGEGGLTSFAYVDYAFRGGRGVPEQNAYVILELFGLPLRTSWLQTHICLNSFLWSYLTICIDP